MIEKQYVTRSEWKKHTQAPWNKSHNLWKHIKNFVPGWGYSKSEIDAFFEGEASGKKQVHWDRVTNKPATFPPSAHASSHHSGGSDLLAFASIPGFGTYIDQAVKQASNVSFGNITGAGWGVFPSGIRTTVSGASSAYIWAVSGAYPTYGLYYNTGTPDWMEWHWSAVVKAKLNMETGDFYPEKIYPGLGAYYLDTLIANNKVPDSDKVDGYHLSQIGGQIKLDDLATPDDNTDLNVGLARHGLFPKLSGHEAECYAGDGAWLRLYDSTSIIIKILSVSSSNDRNTNDTEREFDNASYTKIKEIKMDEPTGLMTVEWEYRISGTGTAYTKVYVNGSPVSSERSTSSESYQQETHTLVANLALNDLVQIYAYNTGAPTTVLVRNMRMQYDRAITMLGECVLASGLTLTTQNHFLMTNQDP